jgi:molybdate transport system substrate-binding protein
MAARHRAATASRCGRLCWHEPGRLPAREGGSEMKMGAICAGAMLAMTGWLGGSLGPAAAAEIKVMASAAIHDAYVELIPAFERATENKVVTEWVPTAEMMRRLKSGETVDLVLMASNGIAELNKLGKVGPGTPVAKSGIGVSVRAGAPKPDISSSDAFKRTLLAAKSVAMSTGPSGVYLAKLFERLGVADEIKGKVKQVQGVPIGEVVARGDAEIGFQQVSELLPVKGTTYVGPLPADIQEITVFDAAVHTGAASADGARALIKFLTTPQAGEAYKKIGMEPG